MLTSTQERMSNLWSSLLRGLAAAQSGKKGVGARSTWSLLTFAPHAIAGPLEDPVVFQDGMAELARFLGDRLKADADVHLPPSLAVEDKHLSAARIGLTVHLLETAIEVIGAR